MNAKTIVNIDLNNDQVDKIKAALKRELPQTFATLQQAESLSLPVPIPTQEAACEFFIDGKFADMWQIAIGIKCK